MKRLAKTLILTAAVITLTACQTAGPSETPSLSGVWGSQQPEEPWLEFLSDGKLTGNDGCNQLMGGWNAGGSEVFAGPLASTRMFCEGVDTWLGDMHRGVVEGDSLIIFDEKDQEIGTLQRGDA